MKTFKTLTGQNPEQKVLDVGAYQISGDPIYAPILGAGNATLVGFEPNPDALARLIEANIPHTTYLPYAIGDGGRHTLYMCAAPDMTSLFEPNPSVLNLFHGFPAWSQIVGTEEVDTVQLDSVPQARGATFIQMDIQGAELMALQSARECLKDALVLHVEVEFIPLYKNQPLFSDVERYLRDQGFMLHKFCDMMSRLVQPMMLNDSAFAGLDQILWADAVFIRDLSNLSVLSRKQLLAFAAIMHDCYLSVDIALHLLQHFDQRSGSKLGALYFTELTREGRQEAAAS